MVPSLMENGTSNAVRRRAYQLSGYVEGNGPGQRAAAVCRGDCTLPEALSVNADDATEGLNVPGPARSVAAVNDKLLPESDKISAEIHQHDVALAAESRGFFRHEDRLSEQGARDAGRGGLNPYVIVAGVADLCQLRNDRRGDYPYSIQQAGRGHAGIKVDDVRIGDLVCGGTVHGNNARAVQNAERFSNAVTRQE